MTLFRWLRQHQRSLVVMLGLLGLIINYMKSIKLERRERKLMHGIQKKRRKETMDILSGALSALKLKIVALTQCENLFLNISNQPEQGEGGGSGNEELSDHVVSTLSPPRMFQREHTMSRKPSFSHSPSMQKYNLSRTLSQIEENEQWESFKTQTMVRGLLSLLSMSHLYCFVLLQLLLIQINPSRVPPKRSMRQHKLDWLNADEKIQLVNHVQQFFNESLPQMHELLTRVVQPAARNYMMDHVFDPNAFRHLMETLQETYLEGYHARIPAMYASMASPCLYDIFESYVFRRVLAEVSEIMLRVFITNMYIRLNRAHQPFQFSYILNQMHHEINDGIFLVDNPNEYKRHIHGNASLRMFQDGFHVLHQPSQRIVLI